MQITSEVDVRESIREISNFRAVCTDNYCSMKYINDSLLYTWIYVGS